MRTSVRIWLAVAILPVLGGIGVYTGLYQRHGAFVSTQLAWFLISLGLSSFGCFLIYVKRRFSIITIPIYFVLTQAVLHFSNVYGQVLYYEPETMAELRELYKIGLEGRL